MTYPVSRNGTAARTVVMLASFAAMLLLPMAAGAQPTQTQAPPPTTVPAPGGGTSPSPFPSVLLTPPPSAKVPDIAAGSAELADLDTGQVLFTKDSGERRPIASLTKIMTALLVLEKTRPSAIATVSPEAADPEPTPGVSNLGLQPGERISVEDLLYALLLQSANDAALALAEDVSGSVSGFVESMNAEAHDLGASHTRFASPNGLDDAGYSTAADLVTITRAAYARPLFAKIAATRFREIPPATPLADPRLIQNRNVLLWLYPGAIGAKTGFTTEAGSCVVAVAERDGRRLVAVVLGSPGEPFSEAAALLNYGFDGFTQRTLVEVGDQFGTVAIQGRAVAVVAAGNLERLVPVRARITRDIRVDPGLAFPPPEGEEIASVSVAADDVRLGRVPLVVSSVPAPPPPSEGTWWSRSIGAAVRAVSSLVHSFLH